MAEKLGDKELVSFKEMLMKNKGVFILDRI
jgi:hypothetical protein